MKKYKRKIENIDKFISALEEMIDARDDMWKEEEHCNYRHADIIKERRYLPARELLRESLYDFIVEVIDEEDTSIDDSKAA